MRLIRVVHSAPLICAAVYVAGIFSLPLRAQQAHTNSSGSSSSSILFVLDTSNSAKSSIQTLKHAAANAAKQFGSDHELALMTTGGQPKLVQDFTGDSSLVVEAIERSRPGGGLALYETLAAAVRQVRSNAVNDRKAIIAYVSNLERANKVPVGWQQNLRGSPAVPIYIISLRGGSWETMEQAQQIAVLNGGAVYAPMKASELAKLSKTIAERLGATGSDETNAKANEPLRPLSGYTTLVVREIPVKQSEDTKEVGGGENLLLQRILVSRLQSAKIFNDVQDGGEAPEAAPSASAGSSTTSPQSTELEMLPMIVGFQRGSRVQRQFAFTAPFGGASRMRVQVILRDRNTKEILATFVEQGSHSSGLFGGSDEKVQAEAMLAVSNHIVDNIRRMKHHK